MRRISFTVSTLLLSGMLLQTSGNLHADFVTSKTTPDTYNPMSHADVQKWNDLYSAGKISFVEYQAALLKLEKSVNTVSSSDVISIGSLMPSRSGAVIHAAAPINPPVSGNKISIGETEMTVTWGADGNPDGTLYVIEISNDPGFHPVSERITTTDLSATFAGLTPGTQYYFHVQAIDPKTNATSAFSRLPSASTLNDIPGGPTSVTAVDRGDYQGNHYWELYWTLPQGYTCPKPSAQAAGNQDFVYLAHSSSQVQQSYAGASGYSPLVCQVNVYDRTNNGPNMVWFDYGQVLNGQANPIALPADSIELSF